MNETILGLVKAFCEVARDLQKDYVEGWLNGKVNDFDMDMALLNEKHAREQYYQKVIDCERRLEMSG